MAIALPSGRTWKYFSIPLCGKDSPLARRRCSACIYVFLAGRLFVASLFGERPELVSLQRAVRLDRGNADYRNHLGRYYALVARDPGAAIAPYRAAVQLESALCPLLVRSRLGLPGAGRYLESNLGAGTSDRSRSHHARRGLGGRQFYLVQGDNEKALREFHVVLENDPVSGGPGDSISAGASIRMWIELLRDVVPAKAAAYVAFLDSAHEQTGDAGNRQSLGRADGDQRAFELRQVYD